MYDGDIAAVWRAPTGRRGVVCDDARALFRQRAHRAYQPGDRGRVHAAAHDLAQDADRLPVGPELLGLGVEPGGPGIDVQDPLHPHRAGLVVRILDRAPRLQDLVRAHGRVADEDDLIVVPVL